MKFKLNCSILWRRDQNHPKLSFTQMKIVRLLFTLFVIQTKPSFKPFKEITKCKCISRSYVHFLVFLLSFDNSFLPLLNQKSPIDLFSVPESPPTNVEGFTMSTTSVSIYWDDVPWGTSHGIIIGYVCYYRRMNDGPPADELRILMQENQ